MIAYQHRTESVAWVRPTWSGPAVAEPSRLSSTSAKRGRLANVERLRVLAIVDIVGFHVDTEHLSASALGGTGLVLFLLMAHTFHVAIAERMSLEAFTRLKVRRLMVPWLFWSGVYFVWNVVLALRANEAWNARLDVWMFTYGTSIHLWFVPFACVTGIFVVWAHQRLKAASPARVIYGTAIVGVLTLLIFRPMADGFGAPAAQYMLGLPGVFLGLVLGRYYIMPDGRGRESTLYVLAGATLVLALLTEPLGFHPATTKWCGALLVMLAVLRWPGKMDGLTARLTPLLFTVYLIHALVVEVLYAVPGISSSTWLHTLAATILSFVAARIIVASPLRTFS